MGFTSVETILFLYGPYSMSIMYGVMDIACWVMAIRVLHLGFLLA